MFKKIQIFVLAAALIGLLLSQFNVVAAVQTVNNPISAPISTPFVSTKADLTPTRFRAPDTAKPGDTIVVNWGVKNQGNKEAVHSPTTSAWEDRVYLSADQTYDSGDFYMGKFRQTETVGAGESYRASANLYVPYKAAEGNYYLILRVDNYNDVAESDNGNNQMLKTIQVSRR